MADKAKNSKKPWSDTRKKSQSGNRSVQDKNRAKRKADQQHRELENRAKRKNGEPTPWELAKAKRAEARAGKPMTPRTRHGNLMRKQPDGSIRIEPGTLLEQRQYLATLESERVEEIRREAEARKTKVKKAKKEKAA